MTTNQTINGVPHKMLTAILCKLDEFNNRALVGELRALLDAPVNPLSELEVLRAAVKELEAMRDARVDAKLAQAQGEPVAWFVQWNSILPRITGHREVVLVQPFFSPGAATVTPLYAEQPAPVAAEYKLHMGDALKVFEALKVHRISRKVEQENLGPMGATEIETWSTAIGVTLEMHTAMGGCTLIVRTAPVAVVHMCDCNQGRLSCNGRGKP